MTIIGRLGETMHNSIRRLAAFLLFVISWQLTLSWCVQVAAQQPDKPTLNHREPWTTSRLVGSPEPPAPYQVELAFPRRTFDRPVVMTNAPATDRMFVAEQGGKIFSFETTRDGASMDLVVDLKAARPELQAIYGLAFHPRVEQNGFVFVCYIQGRNIDDGTRVSRFSLTDNDPPTIDPSTEHILLTWLSGGHNGGCLKFGHDGYLYISTGDAAAPTPPDGLTVGQNMGTLLSKILRIDVDQNEGEQPYRIPEDNPFVNLPGARREIWSYGFRNPWKMSFDRRTGDLWVGDVGWELWEMIYRVHKGGNYGWSIMEGRQPVRTEQEPGPTPILPPTLDHPHSEAGSITGGFVYRGDRLPELSGAYIYGDYQSGIVWGARLEGEQITWRGELARTSLQLVGFAEDHAGELYLLDYQGQIFQLVKNPTKDTSGNFPRRLSETGLFESVSEQRPAAGVVPYVINAEAWSDHTRSQRWLAVPDQGQITVNEKGDWQFPDGSVVVKTVSMDHLRGDPGEAATFKTRRLETQLLHREAGSWRTYTYAWDENQLDAELVNAEGFSRNLVVRDPAASGATREQIYRFAARQECVLCHNPWVEARTTIFGEQSASLLGVRGEQLDRSHLLVRNPRGGGPDGVAHDRHANGADNSINQIETLIQIGLLDAQPEALRRVATLTNPYDESAEVNQRARSYLQVNCAHCHQFNAGGVATIVLARDVPLEKAHLLDARPSQGTFGITNAKLVAPGDPLGSVLLYRLAKLGGGRMPRIGSHAVDDAAVRLMHDWISQLPTSSTTPVPAIEATSVPPSEPPPPTTERPHSGSHETEFATWLDQLRDDTPLSERAAAITELTESTRGALALAIRVSQARVSLSVRDQIVELTRDHTRTEVRDLFERFVPVDERVQRLGDKVDTGKLLAMVASAERGRGVFFNNATAACKNCHRIGDVGEAFGPDLSKIGAKYQRAQLLQHMLEPSTFIEPKYVPYLLETADGRVLSGLLASQSDREVVLQDAQRKLHRVARNDIELLVRQQRSLMPDLLLRDMTPQDVADLLAFLSTLR